MRGRRRKGKKEEEDEGTLNPRKANAQARNVLRYLRIIYNLLENDGIWINIGPLLWHFENSPTVSARGEGSVELSLDEVKDLARIVGFELSVSRVRGLCASEGVLSTQALRLDETVVNRVQVGG
jgi:hypothetical protein